MAYNQSEELFVQGKWVMALAAGAIFAPISAFLTNMGVDINLLLGVFIAVIVDSALGMYIALKEKRFSSTGFAKIMIKLLLYLLLAVLAGAMKRFEGIEFVSSIVYTAMFTREAISILAEKIPKIDKKLGDFTRNLVGKLPFNRRGEDNQNNTPTN